jgi:hypothetical protein
MGPLTENPRARVIYCERTHGFEEACKLTPKAVKEARSLLEAEERIKMK